MRGKPDRDGQQSATTLNRRDFLALFGKGALFASAVLGLGSVLRFLSHRSQEAQLREFDVGAIEMYPLATRQYLPEIPAMLVHDEDGLHAYSMICTHLGCQLKPDESGYACPCHGSHFDREGNVTNGPAEKPLKNLLVEERAGGRVFVVIINE